MKKCRKIQCIVYFRETVLIHCKLSEIRMNIVIIIENLMQKTK